MYTGGSLEMTVAHTHTNTQIMDDSNLWFSHASTINNLKYYNNIIDITCGHRA